MKFIDRMVSITHSFKFLWTLMVCVITFSCSNSNTSQDNDSSLDSLYSVMIDTLRLSLNKENSNLNIDNWLNRAKVLRSDSNKVNLYYELANVFDKRGDVDSFKKVNNEIFKLGASMKDSAVVAGSYYNLARFYRKNERLDSAFNYFFKAQSLYEKIEDNRFAGRALLSMGIIQKNARDYLGGENSTINALKFLEKANDERYVPSAYSNLGLIAYEMERFDEAISYQQKAMELRRRLKAEIPEIISLNNIGIAYAGKEEYEEAINFYNQGLKYEGLLQKRPTLYARLIDNKAYAKLKSKDYSQLPGLMVKALNIRDSINDNLGAVTSYLRMSEYYRSIDSLKKAQTYATIALEKSRPLNYHRGILLSTRLLMDISSPDIALKYAKIRSDLTDSLQFQERTFREQFTRIRYQTNTIQIEKDKISKQNRNLILLILVLLVTSLITYIFIQRRAIKKELLFRESQEESNNEIYNLMLTQQLKFEEGKQIEKKRISEELHDGILGRMFGARLSLDGLNKRQDNNVIETRAKYIDELKSIEDEIRKISHDLNSEIFNSELRYMDVVEELIAKQSEISKLEYSFDHDVSINWDSLPHTNKVHLYRIIQEALQNVHKHAKANSVHIKFEEQNGLIQLSIEDDGIGISNGKIRQGIGLKNIRSRVKKISGSLNLTNNGSNGTKILVKLNN